MQGPVPAKAVATCGQAGRGAGGVFSMGRFGRAVGAGRAAAAEEEAAVALSGPEAFHDKYRCLLWARGIKRVIARRNTEHGPGSANTAGSSCRRCIPGGVIAAWVETQHIAPRVRASRPRTGNTVGTSTYTRPIGLASIAIQALLSRAEAAAEASRA